MDIKISEFPLLNVEVASNAVIPIVQNNTNYTLGVSVSAVNNSLPMRNSLGGINSISFNLYDNNNNAYGKLKIDELSSDQNWIFPDNSGIVVVADPITYDVQIGGNMAINGMPEHVSHNAADNALTSGSLYTLVGSRVVYHIPNFNPQ